MRLAKDAAGLRNSGLLEAQIHMQLGDAMQALAAFTEEEKQCRKEDNQKGLGYSLLLQSGAVRALGQRDEALRLVDQAIEICTRCGAKDILELCLNAKLDMLSERSRQPT
jgi:tetratricopeptide (TPR) repeat protein